MKTKKLQKADAKNQLINQLPVSDWVYALSEGKKVYRGIGYMGKAKKEAFYRDKRITSTR